MLDRLSPRPGARRERKRVGRGPGTGHHKTAGRGTKGQGKRSPGRETIRTSAMNAGICERCVTPASGPPTGSPDVCASRCRVVIAERSGSGRPRHSLRYLPSGASRSSRPCCTSSITALVVPTAFVSDARS